LVIHEEVVDLPYYDLMMGFLKMEQLLTSVTDFLTRIGGGFLESFTNILLPLSLPRSGVFWGDAVPSMLNCCATYSIKFYYSKLAEN
jgi:hypothetical protein